MLIKSAEFIQSSPALEQCPKPEYPEYAFIGRSNVGKSSLINMLVGRKSLAKTSSTPGKTQLINHFLINNQWYLVDLPGYGYAHVSKKSRAKWVKMIREYLSKRENLMNIFVLIDIRIKPQENDLDFMKWLGKKQLPFAIIFTKIDKIPVNQRNNNYLNYEQELLKSWHYMPPVFFASAVKKSGKEEILEYIEETKSSFKK